MTDNEIIKALKCCGRRHNERNDTYCNECQFNNCLPCVAFLCDRTIDLINRQKEEINELKQLFVATEYKDIPVTMERVYKVGWDSALVEAIKTKAINEFMEKWRIELKDIRANFIIKPTYIDKTFDIAITVAERVAKEMTED